MASFHAGSCTARARAARESVTARVSRTILGMLFSGCSSVSPRELTWTPYRKRRNFGSSTPYRSCVIRSQSVTNARILHISSMKRMPALQKKEMRPTTCGMSSRGTSTESSTATAFAIAIATS